MIANGKSTIMTTAVVALVENSFGIGVRLFMIRPRTEMKTAGLWRFAADAIKKTQILHRMAGENTGWRNRAIPCRKKSP